jgi:predicted DNA binding CopG/RHH family protein
MPDTKLTIRCSPELLAQVKIRAIEERTTVAALITRIVVEYLKGTR